MSLPSNPHDWALWLFENLEDIKPWDEVSYRGRLPGSFDFDDIDSRLSREAADIHGISDPSKRIIEFHPESALVYEGIDRFLANPQNRAAPPVRFTIVALKYTHGLTTSKPEVIQQYIKSTQLWGLVCALSDYDQDSGRLQNFIESYEAKIGIRLEYKGGDLRPLPDLSSFVKEFLETDTHKTQKRNIFRNSLIESFKGEHVIPFSTFLDEFERFKDNARNAYSMYAADFSYKKVKDAVERENLEDALRLNKILASLQNQLLALPAAILLAGIYIQPGDVYRNLAVTLGVFVFSVFMWILVGNQMSSLDAINKEIQLRKANLKNLPSDLFNKLSSAFCGLEKRRKKQKAMLWMIRVVVIAVLLSVIGLACIHTNDDSKKSSGQVSHANMAKNFDTRFFLPYGRCREYDSAIGWRVS